MVSFNSGLVAQVSFRQSHSQCYLR